MLWFLFFPTFILIRLEVWIILWVEEGGQEILREYDIDPIFGSENLAWAPNRVRGQQSIVALKNIVDNIKEVKK